MLTVMVAKMVALKMVALKEPPPHREARGFLAPLCVWFGQRSNSPCLMAWTNRVHAWSLTASSGPGTFLESRMPTMPGWLVQTSTQLPPWPLLWLLFHHMARGRSGFIPSPPWSLSSRQFVRYTGDEST